MHPGLHIRGRSPSGARPFGSPGSAAQEGRRLPSTAVPLPDEAVPGPGQLGGTPGALASVHLGVSADCPGTQLPWLIEGPFV